MPGFPTLGGHQSLLADVPHDAYEITEERAGYLAEMMTRPADYTQRFVEQLSFVPTGGLRWQRNLQIQLPAADRPQTRWWILSLGPFNRRRLPDICAINEAGEPLNLLTRRAHGLALSRATFARQIVELSETTRLALEQPDPEDRLDELKKRTNEYFVATTDRPVDIAALDPPAAATSDAEPHPRIVDAEAIVNDYRRLLEDVGAPKDETTESRRALSAVLEQAIDTTQYLCWIWGRPGEVVNVRVTHTIADPQHKLKRKTIRSALMAMWTGFVTGNRRMPNPPPEPSQRELRRKRRRKEAADWFRRFGLAPINYDLNVPTYQHTASYYSTIAPPKGTDLTYLDWQSGNSYEEQQNEYSETSSSLPSVHIYNASASSREGDAETGSEGEVKTHPRSIRAYFRCKPHHHKQILGAAMLNILFVWLLADGRLPGRPGDPLQGLVVAAPSVLVAFLAQQQRHYYEHLLRPSRGILWAYLAVGGAFLVAVAFSGQEVSAGGAGVGFLASVAAWLLAISSVAIIVWHFPLGHMYEWIVGKRFRRRLRTEMWEHKWQAYEAAYESFARLIWRLVLGFSLATVVFLIAFWNPPDGTTGREAKGTAKPVLVHGGERDSTPRIGQRTRAD